MKKSLLKILVLILIMVQVAMPTFAITFSDLSENHWAYKNIMGLAEQKIINGYEDGTYLPEKTVRRAEFFKLIVMAADAEYYEKHYGTLVKALGADLPHWALFYKSYLQDKGYMMQGKEYTSLDDEITREEMAIVLGKLAEDKHYRGLYSWSDDGSDDEDINFTLTDVEAMQEGEAKTFIKRCVSLGFITGYPEDDGTATFRGDRSMTRAEAATVITRVLNGKAGVEIE